MANIAVPVSEASHRVLEELALRGGEPIDRVLDKAIEEYRRSRLLAESNAAYAQLRANPEAWQEELSERREWDATLADGLDS